MKMALRRGVGFIIASLFVGAAHAEAPAAADARMLELEKQMKAMAQELTELRQELAKAKESKDADKKNDDTTVHASFKNGLVFKDGSGTWSFQPYVRIQVDDRNFTPDAFAGDTFTLRRARLGAIATFLKDFTVRIEGEYGEGGAGATANVRLNDAWLEYTRWSGANIRVGQLKPYLGLERTQGAMDLNFMERAFADQMIGSVFDKGIMVHGEPLAGLYYHVAYVNGTGQNLEESNTDAKHDTKDVSARLTGNLAQWLGWSNSVAHVGGWYAYGHQAAGSAVPAMRTEGRGATFFSTSATTKDTLDAQADRTRWGLETALAYGPVKFQGEYAGVNYEGSNFDRDMSAWYASLQWAVTGERYVDQYKKSAFGRLVPKNNFNSADGWGALELGLRYSKFDASDFRTSAVTNPTGTGRLTPATASTAYTNEADAWTLGAKWVLNPNSMIVLNYVHTEFDTPIVVNSHRDDNEDALNMRLQFDF